MRSQDAERGSTEAALTNEAGVGGGGGVFSWATGCAFVACAGLFSCVMLGVNGALVMATLSALAAGGSTWVVQPGTQQFFLLAIPAGLLILQWVMIDYLGWLLRRFWSGGSQGNDHSDREA